MPFLGQAKTNPKDERIFVLAEVFGSASQSGRLPLRYFERAFFEAIRAIRHMQSQNQAIHGGTGYSFTSTPSWTPPKMNSLFSKHLEPYTRGIIKRSTNPRQNQSTSF